MERKKANNLDGTEWARYSISVWSDIKKNTDELHLKHPAIFPQALVTRLLKCFTNEQEKRVLDPFMGSGTTLLAASHMGKYGIGLELVEDYIASAESRLNRENFLVSRGYEIHKADARELLTVIAPETVDICITSPPYWDILLQKRTADHKQVRNYGNEEKDLGRIREYGKFLEALARVFFNVFAALKKGKYCIVNVMDIRKKSRFYPLHSDLADKMKGIGFILDDIIIWDRRQEYNNLRTLGYPSVFRLNKVHEFLLIFKKP